MSHFDCWQAAPAGNDTALAGELETVAKKALAPVREGKFGRRANEAVNGSVLPGCDGLTRGNEGSKAQECCDLGGWPVESLSALDHACNSRSKSARTRKPSHHRPIGVISLFSRIFLPAAAIATLSSPAAAFASGNAPAFYDGALCKPPYTMQSATELYDAAEKLAKPDTSLLTAYVYKLPSDIGQDGFKTHEVVFAGSSVGVLIEGARADELAARYQLEPEKSSILGTSTKGYARVLPDAEQPTADMGIVSVVARESDAIPGKTLLACEFVSHADREALKSLEGGN